MPLKIAIVVHGRFHSFDLARGLVERGHDITVLTNYPRQTASRFGLSPAQFRSFPAHGIMNRAVAATRSVTLGRGFEEFGHPLFGRWAARTLACERWDAVHCWSGVAEETLRASFPPETVRMLMRGSAHIAVQRQLLQDEQVRVSVPLDQPSDWIVARERREYDLVDHIVVLSSFAKQSFIDQGIPASKLTLLSLGVRIDAFRPSPAVMAERVARIRRGQPLTVLFVGNLSFQKGLWDLAQVIKSVDPARFRFVLVGKVLPEVQKLVAAFPADVQVVGKVPQAELPEIYTKGDLFLLPTLQDGFAVVLAQAKAAGLPLITTPNGAGYDIVKSPKDGWIVPIRDAAAIVDRLRWCDQHREELAGMIETNASEVRSRSWTEVAADFEEIVRRLQAARRRTLQGALVHG
jgi:glycosyltransferase involved in cell wall biosynthesis